MNYSVKVAVYYMDETLLEIIPISSLLISGIERILGRELGEDETISCVYLNSIHSSRAELPGNPTIINLTPEYGYASVTVKKGNGITYQHPHSVEELVSETLQRRLQQQYPQEKCWKFKILVPSASSSITAEDSNNDSYPAPQVLGAMPIIPYTEDEAMPFTISKAPEPPLAKNTLENFRCFLGGTGESDSIQVLVHEQVVENFLERQPFSIKIEQGGFLLGKAYQQANQDNHYLIEVTRALSAEYTGASLLHFTYTGDSFSAIKRILREQYPQERLLGWYHTHLFPSSVPMGLSSIDWELHFTTFRIPWQIAGLVNLDSHTQRTLRFFVRHNNFMLTCPWWTITS